MRIAHFHAENFKRLKVVEITPDGNLVTIGGQNDSGKSSVLDAIYVALRGRAANPPRPVREGEEVCTIKVDFGDLIVTRRFTAKEGGTYTDTLKVENADGMRYPRPQETLDALLGEIGFDPFEFAQKSAKQQAATILQMVPLSVDLDELAEHDRLDFEARRFLNRDLQAAKAQLAAIPEEDVPDDAPDREALTDALGNAANHNAAVGREIGRREDLQAIIDRRKDEFASNVETIGKLRAQIMELERLNGMLETGTAEREKELLELPPVGLLIDTDEIREKLRTAETVLAAIDRQKRRAAIAGNVAELQALSDAKTAALEERKRKRNEALAAAPMPVDGLGIALDDNGDPYLTWQGLPFDKDQISTAIQLRVSTAIGMAANPSLRVLRIKDGSLLDTESMKLMAEMAADQDFQLWVEVVGENGAGVIMEAGEVKGDAPAAEPGLLV